MFSVSDKQVLSSLHLQMSLYFNMWFFPLWWISESVMLNLKVRQCETVCHAVTERQDFIKIRPLLSVHPNHVTNDSLPPPSFSSVSCLTRLLQVHLGHSTHSDDSDRSYQALSGLCWKSSGKGYKCIDCDDHIHNVFWCNNAFVTRVLGMQSSLCSTFIQAF